ncbi:MAG: pyridoxal phosphate-dependent aminotransferase family protein [Bacteroidales bacterium]|jgi:glycine C-acetyltransferase|nr:pyridoxal phosphate-dependent aminotransferase family protein [Bacteroidales bacterium]
MDLFEKVMERAKTADLGKYQAGADGYFMFPKLEGEIGPEMNFRTPFGVKPILNWSLNNYLGLANDPEVRKADAEGAAKYGLAAPMGARMMSGQTVMHEELEAMLAKYAKKEAAFVVNFGYQAMISIIDCIVDRKDVIVYDYEAHACIMDGIFLHKSKCGGEKMSYVYPHNDMEKLEKQLKLATKKVAETGGSILVITEGVFGMAGDLGNLKGITDLKEKYNFRLLIDDAHGFGTMGPNGGGTGEHFGVQDKVDLYFATFAKAGAGIGGFIASEKPIIDYLRMNMRSQIYAKSLPMPMVVGLKKRLELMTTNPKYRENLWKIVHAIQDGFRKDGFDIGKTQSPVTPVYMHGDPNASDVECTAEATNLLLDLRENYGIFCSIVVYPVVPKGTVMFRVIPTAAHTLEHVERTINAFKECKKKLDEGRYKAKQVNPWDMLKAGKVEF